MQAAVLEGQQTSVVTDYILKVKVQIHKIEKGIHMICETILGFSYVFPKILQILGLEVCADIMVGDGMIRGISGGQKKRVTTGIILLINMTKKV